MPDQFPIPIPFFRPRFGRRVDRTRVTRGLLQPYLEARAAAAGMPAPAVPPVVTTRDELEELLERDVGPRDRVSDLDELLERPVSTPDEREASSIFRELLERPVGRGILRGLRVLGPLGGLVDIATPSPLGSGEVSPEEREASRDREIERLMTEGWPQPTQPIAVPMPAPPAPPPPDPPTVPFPELELPNPQFPVPTPLPAPQPGPISPVGTTSPVTPGLSTPGFPFVLPFPLPRSRRELRRTLKDRLRDLLLQRLQPGTAVSALPIPEAAPAPAAAPAPGPAPAPQPQANPMPSWLTGLGLGQLRLPRTAPSSAPGLSESCTQCAIDKCVQSAMDKARQSRRRKKKTSRRRKQPKLCVSAPRSLSSLLKLLK